MAKRFSVFSVLAFLALAVPGGGAACDVVSDVGDALNLPIEFDHSVNTSVNVGAVTGAAAGNPSPADASYPLDTGAIPVDLASSSSELAANKSKIREITFTEILVTPTTNTLTNPTPPLDVFVGAKGATSSAGAIKIATIPPIPPGSTAAVAATIDTAGQAAAQQHILTLDFTVIPSATLEVKQGETVPGGAANLTITLGVKAVFNPTK